MKKFLGLLVAFIAIVSLVSCGGGEGTTGGSKTTAEKAAEASRMTTAQLVEKAKEEKGQFVAYGNTSRITTAMENFIAKYGEELGLNKDNATASKQSDTEIYTLLSSEFTSSNNEKGASMVLVQDSATLATYRAKTKMLVNYVPNGAEEYMGKDEMVPLTHQYINKLFIWNNTAGEAAPAFTNVWELTDAKYAGKIFFKSPDTEQVNMNFLTMLTSKEWTAKLAEAYQAYYGTAYVAEEKYETIAYKWIAEFLANADMTSYTSDTKMAAGVSKVENADKVGLFVLSKLRDKSVTSENLTVGCWTEQSITPFAGFMYSIYAQVAENAPRPYTAMLFINYLMTEEGFAPWKTAVGGYSANTTIPAYDGDKDIAFYKSQLVVENGDYISTVKTKVEDFVSKIIASKAK